MTTPWRTRLSLMVAVAAGLLLLGGPAWADGAGPTSYRSQVTAVTPDVAGVHLSVVGGDAFLELRVEPGHTVTVLGYGRGGRDEEPYLHVDAGGTVFVNVNSPASYLNEDRYADVEIPSSASVDADPEWQQVATGGVYRWHDHRIHWMSPDLPRAVERDPGDRVLVQEWTVPLEVDGQPVEVAGELRWLAPRTPLWPLVVGVVAAAAVLGAWRSSRSAAAGAVGALVAAVAAAVAAAGLASAPGVTVADTALLVLLPVVGAGLAALALTRHGRERAQVVLLAAGAVLGWTLPRLADTVAPVIPGGLPDAAVTAGIAAAAGAAAAAAGIAVLGLRGRGTAAGTPDAPTSDAPTPDAETAGT